MFLWMPLGLVQTAVRMSIWTFVMVLQMSIQTSPCQHCSHTFTNVEVTMRTCSSCRLAGKNCLCAWHCRRCPTISEHLHLKACCCCCLCCAPFPYFTDESTAQKNLPYGRVFRTEDSSVHGRLPYGSLLYGRVHRTEDSSVQKTLAKEVSF